MDDKERIYIPANDVPFRELCNLFDKLFEGKYNSSKSFKVQDQVELVKEFVDVFIASAAEIRGKKDCTFYPILRLMLPDLDRERGPYNLKSARLANLLVKVISLNPQSSDAKKLLYFKSVASNSHGSDLPSVAYFIVRNRMQDVDNLTIKDINDALDKISKTGGDAEKSAEDVLTDIFKKTTATQKKWFLRILLKDIKVGIGKTHILAAYHPDAPDMYQLCNSLVKVCDELSRGDIKTPSLGVQLFTPVSPMLSDRLGFDERLDKPGIVTYQVETKYDGERFQIHMENGKFAYFSRRGFNFTKTFGSDYTNGTFTPLLKDCIRSDVKSFIMDGEMMGWHKEKQCLSCKGEAFDVKSLNDKSEYTPFFFAYDLLYYNGQSLVASGPENFGTALCRRQGLLITVFDEVPGVINHTKITYLRNWSDIYDSLQTAITEGEEGIVVKRKHSSYVPGKRTGGWYKLKPEYIEGAMEDLDLLIVGTYKAGKNSRHVPFYKYMLALADKSYPGKMPYYWLSVGCVSIGLNESDRERLRAMLEPHWVDFQAQEPPKCLMWGKKKPHMWIDPKNSVILQIRATEIFTSLSYATDFTLRFPRILKIRDDKPVMDALTIDQFLDISDKSKSSVVKLTKDDVKVHDLTTAAVANRKRQAKPIEVAEHFKAKKGCHANTKGNILDGKKICILCAKSPSDIKDLENVIRANGGTIVPNYDEDTFCCIADDMNARVSLAISSRKCDVVRSDAFKNIREKDFGVINPLYIVSMTDKTLQAVRTKYDKYWDSYTDYVYTGRLKDLLKRMKEEHVPTYLNTDEMISLDEQLFENGISRYSFLRGACIYFAERHYRLKIKASFYGAKLTSTTSNATHIIVDDLAAKDVILASDVRIKLAVTFVTKNWLEACFAKNTYVSENSYIV